MRYVDQHGKKVINTVSLLLEKDHSSMKALILRPQLAIFDCICQVAILIGIEFYEFLYEFFLGFQYLL